MKRIHKLIYNFRSWLCEDIVIDALADAINAEGWLWEEDEMGGIVIDLAYENGYQAGFQAGLSQGFGAIEKIEKYN